MHIALMHRRAVFPLLEVGDMSVRGSLPSIDAALSRLLALTQTGLKDLGFTTRLRDKGIECGMRNPSAQFLKFRLKFDLVSKEALQLMPHSDDSSSDLDDEISVSSGSLSRASSSDSLTSSARSRERQASDAEAATSQLPPRVGARGSSSAAEHDVEDDQQQWLVSAELIIGDPVQFDKVFRKLCGKCSPTGTLRARTLCLPRCLRRAELFRLMRMQARLSRCCSSIDKLRSGAGGSIIVVFYCTILQMSTFI